MRILRNKSNPIILINANRNAIVIGYQVQTHPPIPRDKRVRKRLQDPLSRMQGILVHPLQTVPGQVEKRVEEPSIKKRK
jgi:hypothetical protein